MVAVWAALPAARSQIRYTAEDDCFIGLHRLQDVSKTSETGDHGGKRN